MNLFCRAFELGPQELSAIEVIVISIASSIRIIMIIIIILLLSTARDEWIFFGDRLSNLSALRALRNETDTADDTEKRIFVGESEDRDDFPNGDSVGGFDYGITYIRCLRNRMS